MAPRRPLIGAETARPASGRRRRDVKDRPPKNRNSGAILGIDSRMSRGENGGVKATCGVGPFESPESLACILPAWPQVAFTAPAGSGPSKGPRKIGVQNG